MLENHCVRQCSVRFFCLLPVFYEQKMLGPSQSLRTTVCVPTVLNTSSALRIRGGNKVESVGACLQGTLI